MRDAPKTYDGETQRRCGLQAYGTLPAVFPKALEVMSPEQLSAWEVDPTVSSTETLVRSFSVPSFDAAEEVVPGTVMTITNATLLCTSQTPAAAAMDLEPARSSADTAPEPAASASTPATAPVQPELSHAGAAQADWTPAAPVSTEDEWFLPTSGAESGTGFCTDCPEQVAEATSGYELAQLLQGREQQACNQVVNLSSDVMCAPEPGSKLDTTCRAHR